ncbi:MAG: CapA family protein [Christensenellales bacterium]
MKKPLALLLALLLLLPFGGTAVAEEEEVTLFLQPTASPRPEIAGADPAEGTPTEPPTEKVIDLMPDGSVQITISAVGDLTFGGDVRQGGLSMFDRELKKQGDDLGFVTRNILGVLSEDDMTVANFETTLTTAPVFKKGNEFVFSAPPAYAAILTKGSIEAVSFENNHAMDHGQTGVDETIRAFEENNIVWSAEGHLGVFEVRGVKIGMLAYQTFNGQYPRLFQQVPQDIAAARQQCDILMVSYHWGEEKDYLPNANQQKLGRLTIDAGADLVVGHHSHRINPIELYNGKYIAYSLGNFSFAGNSKPSDMSSYVFQVRFGVRDGEAAVQGFRIIPMRISSKTDYNDFVPTPYKDQLLIDNVINTLLSNGKKLAYAVSAYPVDWQ